MANLMRLTGALALAVVLSGCSTYHSEVELGLDHGALRDQGTRGGIPFQVNGVVGGVQGAALAQAVAAAMPARVGSADVRYAPCTPHTECAGDHVVWTFGPPPARSILEHPSYFHLSPFTVIGYHPGPHTVEAKVVVFQNGDVVASASGQIEAPDGVNSSAFQSMISEMAGSVFSHSPLDYLEVGIF